MGVGFDVIPQSIEHNIAGYMDHGGQIITKSDKSEIKDLDVNSNENKKPNTSNNPGNSKRLLLDFLEDNKSDTYANSGNNQDKKEISNTQTFTSKDDKTKVNSQDKINCAK